MKASFECRLRYPTSGPLALSSGRSGFSKTTRSLCPPDQSDFRVVEGFDSDFDSDFDSLDFDSPAFDDSVDLESVVLDSLVFVWLLWVSLVFVSGDLDSAGLPSSEDL